MVLLVYFVVLGVFLLKAWLPFSRGFSVAEPLDMIRYEDLPPPMALMAALSAYISLIIWMILQNSAASRLYEFIPVIILPPVIFAWVSMTAVVQGFAVKECKRSITVTYPLDTRHRVCSIMRLERGFLVYDREARAAIFIPWPKLTDIRQPAGART
jgi:hypothetical protein